MLTFLQNINVSGTSTIGSDVIVGSGITLSPDGDIFATGITTVGILTVTGRVRIGGDLDVVVILHMMKSLVEILILQVFLPSLALHK